MRKDVVTSTDTTHLEAEPLDKAAQVGEGHIGRSSARETHEKLSLVHREHGNPGLGRDTRMRAASSGRSVSRCAISAVAVAAAMMFSGCGQNQPLAATKPSTTSRTKAICEQASHELLTIDQQRLRPELAVIGRLIEEASLAGEKIDASTTAKVQHLPPNSYSATVLTDLAHSRAELQAVIHAVRRHGIAYARLPRSLVISFLKANSGCGHIRLRQPISG